MKTTKYILETEGSGKVELCYRNGYFHRMELKSGRPNALEWANLMSQVPQHENKLPAAAHAVAEIRSLFAEMMDSYNQWYQHTVGLAPRIDATAGASLKAIVGYLRKIAGDDAEVLASWQYVLNHWNTLDDFYRKQMELRQINSNINIILRQLKHGNTTTAKQNQARSFADALRQKL